MLILYKTISLTLFSLSLSPNTGSKGGGGFKYKLRFMITMKASTALLAVGAALGIGLLVRPYLFGEAGEASDGFVDKTIAGFQERAPAAVVDIAAGTAGAVWETGAGLGDQIAKGSFDFGQRLGYEAYSSATGAPTPGETGAWFFTQATQHQDAIKTAMEPRSVLGAFGLGGLLDRQAAPSPPPAPSTPTPTIPGDELTRGPGGEIRLASEVIESAEAAAGIPPEQRTVRQIVSSVASGTPTAQPQTGRPIAAAEVIGGKLVTVSKPYYK